MNFVRLFSVLVAILFSFVCVAQRDLGAHDSLLFIDKPIPSGIARIELVKVDPVCEEVKRRVQGRFFKKKLLFCSPESILHCYSIEDELFCKVDSSRLSGHVELSSSDIDTLLGILYTTEQSNYIDLCYNPRHGIIFYNDSNEFMGFLEICFECKRVESNDKILDPGLLNTEAFVRLRKIFDEHKFE
ncbi:MAG: hypothetical protein AB8B56_17275 [Crocinitomicaceae bacterium]